VVALRPVRDRVLGGIAAAEGEAMQDIKLDQLSSVTGGARLNLDRMNQAGKDGALAVGSTGAIAGTLTGLFTMPTMFPVFTVAGALAGGAGGYVAGAAKSAIVQLGEKR
jgi:hypothetical protein